MQIFDLVDLVDHSSLDFTFVASKNKKDTARKTKFSIKDFLEFPADLVTLTEEILNGKIHFLSSGSQDK